jgi:hypothetical protein
MRVVILVKQLAKPSTLFILVDHLCKLAGVKPNAVTFVADVDLDVLIVRFE